MSSRVLNSLRIIVLTDVDSQARQRSMNGKGKCDALDGKAHLTEMLGVTGVTVYHDTLPVSCDAVPWQP